MLVLRGSLVPMYPPSHAPVIAYSKHAEMLDEGQARARQGTWTQE